MDPSTGRVKIQPFDLSFFYPISLGLGILLLKILLDKYCFEPIGIKLGIKPLVYPKEKTFNKSLKILDRLPPIKINSKVYYFSSHFNFNERLINVQKLSKFCKSVWQFTFYTFTFTSGMIILWNKTWFWNLRECWTDYRHQHLPNDVWAYNTMNLGFYWSLLITLFLNTRRKDFQENMIHHCVTILLIYLSVNLQCFRIGTIVFVDLCVSDIFLEASKIAKYLNYKKLCMVFFILFTIVWIISRLIIFPFWILNNTIFYSPNVMVSLEWYIFNGLFLPLVVLNFFWTIMIFKVLWKGLTGGEIEDVRSDSESDK